MADGPMSASSMATIGSCGLSLRIVKPLATSRANR